jgi:hypothetical protein
VAIKKCNDPISRYFYFREVAPIFLKMSELYPSITFVTINLEVFTEAASELQVTMVPTLVFTSGKTVLSTVRPKIMTDSSL